MNCGRESAGHSGQMPKTFMCACPSLTHTSPWCHSCQQQTSAWGRTVESGRQHRVLQAALGQLALGRQGGRQSKGSPRGELALGQATLPVLHCAHVYFLWFGCGQQQKCHTAAPPPTRAQRRMERNRQKPVGQDKGSLTEQQTEVTGTTTVQKRGIHKTNPQNRAALSQTAAARSQAKSAGMDGSCGSSLQCWCHSARGL